MKFIPDYIWFFFWALPFRFLGMIWQYLQFIFWSAGFEFKAGSTWVLNSRLKRKQHKGGES